jgi:hypothetical protein
VDVPVLRGGSSLPVLRHCGRLGPASHGLRVTAENGLDLAPADDARGRFRVTCRWCGDQTFVRGDGAAVAHLAHVRTRHAACRRLSDEVVDE